MKLSNLIMMNSYLQNTLNPEGIRMGWDFIKLYASGMPTARIATTITICTTTCTRAETRKGKEYWKWTAFMVNCIVVILPILHGTSTDYRTYILVWSVESKISDENGIE
jgi:hypothetical protein